MEKRSSATMHMHQPKGKVLRAAGMTFPTPTRICNATMPSGTLKISEPAKRPGADNYKKHSSRGCA